MADGLGNSVSLPAVLVSGRNMHYAIERGTLKTTDANHPVVAMEQRRLNGKPQSLSYIVNVPFENWMMGSTAEISFPTDECGCGAPKGKGELPGIPLALNPALEMETPFVTSSVTEIPVSIHNGKARIQFEVDRTELHPEPYGAGTVSASTTAPNSR